MKRFRMWGILLILSVALWAPICGAEGNAGKEKTAAGESKVLENETGYWINTKSKIRHNKKCRYYGKGKNGKPCGPQEGKACKVCGG